MNDILKKDKAVIRKEINMLIKNRITAVGLMFGGIIIYLIITLHNKFNLIDFSYLLFIIGCLARYVYLKLSPQNNE